MTLRKFGDQTYAQAVKLAQLYAVAPFVFNGLAVMRRSGILACLDRLKGDETLSSGEVAEGSGMDLFAVKLLLDMAVAADVVIGDDQGRFCLSKTGRLLASDPMTSANFDFAADVCSRGMDHLGEALRTGTPAGLRELAPGAGTIYQALSGLPEPARTSWFAYDHFYSDRSFAEALRCIASRMTPGLIHDVGGNTGRFALAAAGAFPECRIRIIDLPGQCRLAEENARSAGLEGRISTFPWDLLAADGDLPGEADLWWMSQLVECFSQEQLAGILQLIRRSIRPDALLAVSSFFGDRLPNDVAALVVESQSLYFAALANGVSRFHHFADFLPVAEEAGFALDGEPASLGLGSLLVFLKPVPAV